MIIHHSEWVERLGVAREAKQWRASSIISPDQYGAIKARYTTPLYTPTLFIRIVLFVFTCIALAGVYGIIFLILSPSGDSAFAGFLVFAGLLSFVALELVIKGRKLYQAGIEEALLYAALCLTIGGAVWFYLEATSPPRTAVVPWIVALPFLLWGTVRFADRLVTAAAYACALAVVLVPLSESGTAARASLPFAAMGFGFFSHVLARKHKVKQVLRPWKECLHIVELLGLLTFYCAGNYFVVREGNEALLGALLVEGEDIPLGFLFYALTVVTPILYIARGLMTRDHLLLRTGLLTAVLSVLTFRYYFHLVPPEIVLTIAGIVLFLAAVVTGRLLRTERSGFTAKHLLHEKMKDLDTEGLLVSQTLGISPQPAKKDVAGRGGEFGGGGATGNW